MKKIINYLDKLINDFYQKTGHYPNKIILNKQTNDKINLELLEETDLEFSWYDYKDNYKGIPFLFDNIEGIKLE